jgi:hypothetical protein
VYGRSDSSRSADSNVAGNHVGGGLGGGPAVPEAEHERDGDASDTNQHAEEAAAAAIYAASMGLSWMAAYAPTLGRKLRFGMAGDLSDSLAVTWDDPEFAVRAEAAYGALRIINLSCPRKAVASVPTY